MIINGHGVSLRVLDRGGLNIGARFPRDGRCCQLDGNEIDPDMGRLAWDCIECATRECHPTENAIQPHSANHARKNGIVSEMVLVCEKKMAFAREMVLTMRRKDAAQHEPGLESQEKKIDLAGQTIWISAPKVET